MTSGPHASNVKHKQYICAGTAAEQMLNPYINTHMGIYKMSEGCRARGSDEIRGRVFSFSGNKGELCVLRGTQKGQSVGRGRDETLRGVMCNICD